jgi:hypothetical protein
MLGQVDWQKLKIVLPGILVDCPRKGNIIQKFNALVANGIPALRSIIQLALVR